MRNCSPQKTRRILHCYLSETKKIQAPPAKAELSTSAAVVVVVRIQNAKSWSKQGISRSKNTMRTMQKLSSPLLHGCSVSGLNCWTRLSSTNTSHGHPPATPLHQPSYRITPSRPTLRWYATGCPFDDRFYQYCKRAISCPMVIPGITCWVHIAMNMRTRAAPAPPKLCTRKILKLGGKHGKPIQERFPHQGDSSPLR